MFTRPSTTDHLDLSQLDADFDTVRDVVLDIYIEKAKNKRTLERWKRRVCPCEDDSLCGVLMTGLLLGYTKPKGKAEWSLTDLLLGGRKGATCSELLSTMVDIVLPDQVDQRVGKIQHGHAQYGHHGHPAAAAAAAAPPTDPWHDWK